MAAISRPRRRPHPRRPHSSARAHRRPARRCRCRWPAPGGQATAAATGIRTGIGRTIQLRTDDLPILPPGDLYELWFVGPGDTPNDPNRISAGTFHPDDQGRSHVDLTAAVDPALYPELSVTSEPGDGNPAPTGPEVLRALITLDEP